MTAPNPTMEGIKIKEIRKILDERGYIQHMIRKDDPDFTQFGEIYFAAIFPEAIKGWHLHTKMTMNYEVVVGNIKLVLCDMREGSPTKGQIKEIFMGEDNPLRVQIPPGIANGYKAVGNTRAIVANCADMPHDPTEMIRIDPFSKEITYNWDIKNC